MYAQDIKGEPQVDIKFHSHWKFNQKEKRWLIVSTYYTYIHYTFVENKLVIDSIMEEVENMSITFSSKEEEEDLQLPGFRFHPTDEELVGFYLRRKVEKRPIRLDLIKHVDIYKFDPWDLPSMLFFLID